MRKLFFNSLYDLMKENENIYFITADLGYSFIESLLKDFPDRAWNVGSAEFSMVGMAYGLCKGNNNVCFCYTISPFLLRAAEIIRHIGRGCENIRGVKLIGSGRGDFGPESYFDMGFTHCINQNIETIMMQNLDLICYYPEKESFPHIVEQVFDNDFPSYINLER